jgi:hypothetical protein
MRECDRLGLDDRAERLAVCAALLGVDELGSTGDLVMGQAGQLVNTLRIIRDRAELPDVTAAAVDDDEGQDDEDDRGGESMTLIGAVSSVILVIALNMYGENQADQNRRARPPRISADGARDGTLPAHETVIRAERRSGISARDEGQKRAGAANWPRY